MQSIENDALMCAFKKQTKQAPDCAQFVVVQRVALPARAFPPRMRENHNAFQRSDSL
jgi:hypothetical protein